MRIFFVLLGGLKIGVDAWIMDGWGFINGTEGRKVFVRCELIKCIEWLTRQKIDFSRGWNGTNSIIN